MVFSNGDQYEGDFKDGKISGKGVYLWKNGSTYEGLFDDGEIPLAKDSIVDVEVSVS